MNQHTKTESYQTLQEELIAGYIATANESLIITKEWEATDNADWLIHIPPYQRRNSSLQCTNLNGRFPHDFPQSQ